MPERSLQGLISAMREENCQGQVAAVTWLSGYPMLYYAEDCQFTLQYDVGDRDSSKYLSFGW